MSDIIFLVLSFLKSSLILNSICLTPFIMHAFITFLLEYCLFLSLYMLLNYYCMYQHQTGFLQSDQNLNRLLCCFQWYHQFFVITYKIAIHLINPVSANMIKWSNTLKQLVGKLPTNCLSVFEHFVGLALKGLRLSLRWEKFHLLLLSPLINRFISSTFSLINFLLLDIFLLQ